MPAAGARPPAASRPGACKVQAGRAIRCCSALQLASLGQGEMDAQVSSSSNRRLCVARARSWPQLKRRRACADDSLLQHTRTRNHGLDHPNRNGRPRSDRIGSLAGRFRLRRAKYTRISGYSRWGATPRRPACGRRAACAARAPRAAAHAAPRSCWLWRRWRGCGGTQYRGDTCSSPDCALSRAAVACRAPCGAGSCLHVLPPALGRRLLPEPLAERSGLLHAAPTSAHAGLAPGCSGRRRQQRRERR